MSTKPKATSLSNSNNTFVSPTYTFFLAGNIIANTPIQDTNREKYFNHVILTGKKPTLSGNKNFSVNFVFHRLRVFHLSTEKGTGLIR